MDKLNERLPRRALAILVASGSTALVGCIPWAAFQHESATLAPYCGGDGFDAHIEVELPQGPLQYNGHMLGFDRNALMFDIMLREMPAQDRVFDARAIKVESTPTVYNLTGGAVTIDLRQQRVVVDLQVDGQAFKGNGRFPLVVKNGRCPAR